MLDGWNLSIAEYMKEYASDQSRILVADLMNRHEIKKTG